MPLQLNDGTNNLLGTLNAGTDASYTVDGQPAGGITTDSSTVTIAPGLNVTLEAVGTTTVTRFLQPQFRLEPAFFVRHRLQRGLR